MLKTAAILNGLTILGYVSWFFYMISYTGVNPFR